MLRRLIVQSPWRSLHPSTWPDDAPLGRHSVIYGHNGSGKSTLAELLLSLSRQDVGRTVRWEDERRKASTLSAETPTPPTNLAVFTGQWIQENLRDFLEGDNAPAIVTLGQEAIEAKELESNIQNEISSLQEKLNQTRERNKRATEDRTKLLRDAQNEIDSKLRDSDYNLFSKNKFNITRIGERIRNFTQEVPDTELYSHSLRHLLDPIPATLQMPPPPPPLDPEISASIHRNLSETPTSILIDSLAKDQEAQTWVQQGTRLHTERETCLYCNGKIGQERRDQLANHFDASWSRLTSEATSLTQRIDSHKAGLTSWLDQFPAPDSVAATYREPFSTQLGSLRTAMELRIQTLDSLKSLLESKSQNPTRVLTTPDFDDLLMPVDIEELSTTLAAQNDEAARGESVRSQRQGIILDFILGERKDDLAALDLEVTSTESEFSAVTAILATKEAELEQVREKRFSTKKMADNISNDLSRVYGRNHLAIHVSSDGKSYLCKRGESPATKLSDGERMTLALIYFLRSLEDESRNAIPPSERIVIVDDPSSSLDREALFATHQLLFDTLGRYSQSIVLTHDFGLMRLFLKSRRSQWTKSLKNIKDGDKDETSFPRTAFLEIHAAGTGLDRKSEIRQLPQLLLQATSEYNYLFLKVINGAILGADEDHLFLLPNAARRILEVFCSFKAPNKGDFLAALGSLIDNARLEPYRDVYDFCNRFSHGEGNEVVESLDSRTVHHQIVRCMQFLRAADSEHFERMCAAVKVDPRSLPES